MTLFILFLATCFLAYSNGANDNFKGVATLFGSGTLSYKQALGWATFTTFSGSIASIFLAEGLIRSFSGKGLVPDSISGSPEFMIAVAVGAGLTVILTALRGIPISTTHSLIGALVGTGIIAAGQTVNFNALGTKFFLPLLVSPLIALILGALIYFLLHWIRLRAGITKEWCICVGEKEHIIAVSQEQRILSFAPHSLATIAPEITIDTTDNCTLRYKGSFFGIRLQNIIDSLHFISGGMVCFARALNDTPKIVALLLAANALNLEMSMLAVAIAMAVGGVMNARKIAETMGNNITTLTHGQGFSANIVTSFLVIFASNLGVPVSTTHVSVGTLFGIGYLTGNGDKSVMSGIFLSWLLTLPVAALFASVCYWLIT